MTAKFFNSEFRVSRFASSAVCNPKPGARNSELFFKEVAVATSVVAPMLGKVLKIEKNVGEAVEEDDVVVVLEAMKMEIPVVAPTAGVIKAVLVTPGQAVEAEEILAEIE